jgi:PIN domain nuclease of toxin-antitoxin system
MRILLDTYSVLWAITADSQLGSAARLLLMDPGDQIFVSAASVWEVAIKHRKHPDVMPIRPNVLIDACVASGFNWLDISVHHANATLQLPLLHVDPFDRLLVAQALQEPMILLTRDRQIAAYSELVRLV